MFAVRFLIAALYERRSVIAMLAEIPGVAWVTINISLSISKYTRTHILTPTVPAKPHPTQTLNHELHSNS